MTQSSFLGFIQDDINRIPSAIETIKPCVFPEDFGFTGKDRDLDKIALDRCREFLVSRIGEDGVLIANLHLLKISLDSHSELIDNAIYRLRELSEFVRKKDMIND
jgi:hypothetical protein